MEFDVFFSHNSQDKPAVRALAEKLKQLDVKVWLDEDQLVPGLPWQPALVEGIKQSKTGAVLIGSDGLGPWLNEEMQILLDMAVKEGKPVIPVLLPSASAEPDLPYMLRNRTWVDLRGGKEKSGLERLLWGITGERNASNGGDGTAHELVSPNNARRSWLAGTLVLCGLVTAFVFFRAPTTESADFTLWFVSRESEVLATKSIQLPLTEVREKRNEGELLAFIKGQVVTSNDGVRVYRLSDKSEVTASAGDPFEGENLQLLVVPASIIDSFPDAASAVTFIQSQLDE